MRKMFTHLYEWMWHVSVRRDSVDMPLKGKAALYRYPSPGSIITKDPLPDYRTPFSESAYNVRYANPTNNQVKERISATTTNPVKIDPIRKLVLTHLLKESEQTDPAKVAQAKLKFKESYGYDCEKQYEQNDIAIPRFDSLDREAIRKAYEREYLAEGFKSQDIDILDEEQVENPDIIQFDSLDMYDAPHFQQSRIENAYAIDSILRSRAEGGVQGIPLKKGSAKFWKALDDSNDPHNIEQVQGKIRDENPTDFRIDNAKIKFDFDKQGNVIDIHRVPPN